MSDLIKTEKVLDLLAGVVAEIIKMPQEHTEEHTETHACDLIVRHDAIDTVRNLQTYKLAEGDDMLLVDLADVQTELMMMPSAKPERKIYAKMPDEEFEKWLHDNGICNPNIHESIPCSCVPLLIDSAINELPSAEPQWILCSEKLPEDGTEVFVYLFNRPSPYIAWIKDCRWYTEDFEVESENEPIVWMPLPEPWKGEKDGN